MICLLYDKRRVKKVLSTRFKHRYKPNFLQLYSNTSATENRVKKIENVNKIIFVDMILEKNLMSVPLSPKKMLVDVTQSSNRTCSGRYYQILKCGLS